ncbi:hypothetical protein LWI29_018281 [Acer saccharum]|uniref:MULE transposase domain-containing protein n=1 Tax=Acer saccharum TaxID=4024 RepID=A0AA39W6K8_ACESA|nr:hypothetical protein LWI29_018281 [Acer saccharum]
MIYPLAFGFAHSKCTESWTWFLKQLQNVIQYPERVMFVSDRHAGIFAGMEAIFHDAAHGVCAYHLSQNLKKFCRQWDDVIKLYFRATYLYRVEEFNCEMAELKATHRKVYDELLEALHVYPRAFYLRPPSHKTSIKGNWNQGHMRLQE